MPIVNPWTTAHSMRISLPLMLCLTFAASAIGAKPDREKDRHPDHALKGFLAIPRPDVAWPVADIVLGQPTAEGVTLGLLPNQNLEASVVYGPAAGPDRIQTAWQPLTAGRPATIRLSSLKPDTAYTYQLLCRGSVVVSSPMGTFHTQRQAGRSFCFEVQGDSHLERRQQNAPALYARNLLDAGAESPDFFICMGDDFSVDTLPEVTAKTVRDVYMRHLPYLSLVGHTSPLFLVNGNHEQASAANYNGTPDCVSVWAQTARNSLFPQPAPDSFYSGNDVPVPHIGLLRNYYAWTWGDALFVVLDPYWHTPVAVDNPLGKGKKNRDLWQNTLGEHQYAWLRETLANSNATFKFVFAHHVNGRGRGGIEQATLYEWGGHSPDGSWGFDTRRPGWELPVHQLMVKYGVTIFFQGHDHIFAHQELDGLVYQTLPDPADPACKLNNADAYKSGKILPGSGRLRVIVQPTQVTVDYVRACLSAAETATQHNGDVIYSYTIPDRKEPAR